MYLTAYLYSNYQKVSVFHGTYISQSSKSFCQSLKGSEIWGLWQRKCINHTLKITCSFVQLLLYNLCSQLHPDHYILTIIRIKRTIWDHPGFHFPWLWSSRYQSLRTLQIGSTCLKRMSWYSSNQCHSEMLMQVCHCICQVWRFCTWDFLSSWLWTVLLYSFNYFLWLL